MNRAVGILCIVVASMLLAGLARADDRYGSGAERGATSGATSGTASGTGFMGQHVMTGTVKDVDKDTGKVSIEAEGKSLELHFPQTALQNLSKGDRVTVQLAIKKTGAAGTSGVGAGTPGMHGHGMGGGNDAGQTR